MTTQSESNTYSGFAALSTYLKTTLILKVFPNDPPPQADKLSLGYFLFNNSFLIAPKASQSH